MHTEIDITELRVPLAKPKYEALQDLKDRLRHERSVRRVTTRELIYEAIDLLLARYQALRSSRDADESRARDGEDGGQ